jgi:hypothetical protein
VAPATTGAAATEQPHVNVTALFAEAAGKSGLLWIDVPGDRAWPAWHAWADDTVFVVSGPGEQTLPWLPDEVGLILRSKDTGGRLLSVHRHPRRPAVAGRDRGAQGQPPQRHRRPRHPLGDLVHRPGAAALRHPAGGARPLPRGLGRRPGAAERGHHHRLASVAPRRPTAAAPRLTVPRRPRWRRIALLA